MGVVDAFSREVFGPGARVVVVDRLPDSPHQSWRNEQIVYSRQDKAFFSLVGETWVEITDIKVVRHNSDSDASRPNVAGVIFWVGDVQPTNAVVNDLWLDTS